MVEIEGTYPFVLFSAYGIELRGFSKTREEKNLCWDFLFLIDISKTTNNIIYKE